MNHNPRAVLTAGTLARLGLHSFALYRTAALIITLYPAFQEVYWYTGRRPRRREIERKTRTDEPTEVNG